MEQYGICPIGSYFISCDFGEYAGHKGIDIGWKKTIGYATEVWAWKSGKVVDSNYRSDSGNYVVIEHDHDGYRQWTRYLHLESRNVKIGDKVKQGDVIGIRGNTGKSSGAHLHFQITAQAPLTQAYNRDWCANSGIDPKPLIYKAKDKDYILDSSLNFLQDMPGKKPSEDYKTLYDESQKKLAKAKQLAKEIIDL